MNYFFINIASHDGLLACISKDKVIALREVSTRIRDHELVPLVEECLEEAGWKYQDLDRIACVVGPGGFTSLRVAVSFVNTLMDQLDVEGVGVHLSDLYFERARNPESEIVSPELDAGRNPEIFWLHSTKKDLLFVRGGKWEEPTMISVDELKNEIPEDALWMGEVLDPQLVAEIRKSPLKPVQDILPAFLQNLQYSKNPLEPWYGRQG